jgi:hypothetical protein
MMPLTDENKREMASKSKIENQAKQTKTHNGTIVGRLHTTTNT